MKIELEYINYSYKELFNKIDDCFKHMMDLYDYGMTEDTENTEEIMDALKILKITHSEVERLQVIETLYKYYLDISEVCFKIISRLYEIKTNLEEKELEEREKQYNISKEHIRFMRYIIFELRNYNYIVNSSNNYLLIIH